MINAVHATGQAGYLAPTYPRRLTALAQEAWEQVIECLKEEESVSTQYGIMRVESERLPTKGVIVVRIELEEGYFWNPSEVVDLNRVCPHVGFERSTCEGEEGVLTATVLGRYVPEILCTAGIPWEGR